MMPSPASTASSTANATAPTHLRGTIHRVGQSVGGHLEASYRDSQSKCWANLRILGQPCEFLLCDAAGVFDATLPKTNGVLYSSSRKLLPISAHMRRTCRAMARFSCSA
jgi:hypothetical protein